MARLLLLGALAGCPHPVAGPDWSVVPALPNPRAGGYDNLHRAPTDVAVASLVSPERWSESLSAAAAGLALAAVNGEGGLEGWEVREAAWRGGYAGTITEVQGWTTAREAPPPPELVAWAAAGEGDLGLVRARAPGAEVWVGLRGAVPVSLPPIPREAPLGGHLALPAGEGARWRVTDGGGRLVEGAPGEPLSLNLTVAGEWLLRWEQAGVPIAEFPVYVDIPAPRASLLRRVEGEAASEGLPVLLGEVREAYGAPALSLREGVARAAAGVRAGQAPERALPEAGVLASHAVALSCVAESVPACIDQWVYTLEGREALLLAERAGIASEVEGGALHGLLLLTW
ncbi:MAG: hypothetical protein JXX28_06845 [Deltaproteobacteria bacterium]|nr:hypothetical protein [Deltaproteobacteria bacterium]